MNGNKLKLAALALGAVFSLSVSAETHSNFQTVNSNGVSAWSGTHPVTLVGVLLTDPTEMLDATPNFIPWNNGAGIFQLGAEWQVAVQAALSGDRGGTFLYMGQNYGNMPFRHDSELSYSNAAWSAEINRLNHDPATGHTFKKGDLVSVTANQSAFYGGKRNVNETHDIAPEADFTISLVISNYGLPTPEVLSLASLVQTNDNNAGTREDIFDPTLATGGEHWQSMRVRITGLTLVTSNGWNASAPWGQRLSTATDGEGRVFPLRHPRYSLGAAPTNRFDAIGVLNQESGSGSDGRYGYELFVQEIAPASDATLSIASKKVITWPGSLVNYRLEKTASFSPTNWLPVTNPPVLFNGQNAVIEDGAAPAEFYRLQRVQ